MQAITPKRKLKRPGIKGSKFSSTPGDNRGRPAKLVSYCPICPTELQDPELSPKMTVQSRTKRASCKNGHTWPVGGESHAP